jgi:hypothetical protein
MPESYEEAAHTAAVAEAIVDQGSHAYPVPYGRLPVSEFAYDRAGAASPFGDDQRLPLPPERLTYIHPSEDAGPVHL